MNQKLKKTLPILLAVAGVATIFSQGVSNGVINLGIFAILIGVIWLAIS